MCRKGEGGCEGGRRESIVYGTILASHLNITGPYTVHSMEENRITYFAQTDARNKRVRCEQLHGKHSEIFTVYSILHGIRQCKIEFRHIYSIFYGQNPCKIEYI